MGGRRRARRRPRDARRVLAVARRRGIRAAALLAVDARAGDERIDAEAIADAGMRLGRAALAGARA